ncbi:MAG: hypothetical protein ACOC8F_08265 [Planctomycetota bacterium]
MVRPPAGGGVTMLLAETVGSDIFSRLAAPSQVECVDYLGRAPLILSVPMLIVGLAYLAFGWKLHKLFVIANAAAAGAIGGAVLTGMTAGEAEHGAILFGAAAGGVVCGVLAWPLMRGATSLTGAVAGAVMGFGAWVYGTRVAGYHDLTQHAWAGALVGLVGLALLAYANYRLAVMLFTAVQGSIMVAGSAVSLLMLHEQLDATIRRAATTNAHLLAAVFILPALVGFAVQHAAASRKLKKKLKSASGSGAS